MIVLLGSDKGGTGKSTLTVSIAVALAKLSGENIALIEADKQRSMLKWLNRRNKASITPTFAIKEVYGDAELKRVALKLAQQYKYVLIDTAGRDSIEQRSALTFANVFLSIIRPSTVDIETLEEHTVTIRQALKFNKNMKVLHVLNQCSTNVHDIRSKEFFNLLNDDPDWISPANQRIYDRIVHERAFYEAKGIHEWRDQKAKGELEQLLKEAGIYGA